MQDVSKCWSRQKMAVLERLERDFRRKSNLLYSFFTAACAIYLGGFVGLLLGPETNVLRTVQILLTAFAGVGLLLMFPAVAAFAFVESFLRKRI
jgi:hypothetical protein